MGITEMAAQAGLWSFASACAYVAVRDVAEMRIPNRTVMAVCAGWAVLAPLSGMPANEMALAALAAGAVLALGFAAFAAGVAGGGDAKFAAAAALWVGHAAVPSFLVATALAGAFLAIAVLAARAVRLPAPASGWEWARRLHAGGGVPYGVAISAGALAAMPYAHWAA